MVVIPLYIEPNTTIILIPTCPIDKSYENTLWFDTLADQTNYFTGALSAGIVFQKNSYQRKDKNTLRLEANAESLYSCNYMAFRNINFGTKWFYAFIDKIEYINNNCCEITYTIDVMQTWHFDYFLERCFVEREHSETDEIGDNIVEEELATGPYVAENLSDVDFGIYNGYEGIVWSTFAENQGVYIDTAGMIIQQGSQPVWSGLFGTVFPFTVAGIQAAMFWLQNVPALKVDGIVSMNVAPALSEVPAPISVNIPKYVTLRRLGNHAIKNNKCYTYPYNFLYITNNVGNEAIYRYEFFQREISNQYCGFKAFADFSPNPTMVLYPTDYKGVAENLDEKITLNGFPQIAYNVDAFKAWLAQSASSLAYSGITGLAGAGVGIATGESSVMAMGSVLRGINACVNGIVATAKPPQSKGNQQSNVLLPLDKLKFTYMHKHCTPEYLTIIDDYFDMYGYATKKVKIPNRSSRPEWNFVKTIGCQIHGSLPSDDIKAIEDIYDKGIRFWKNPFHVGDYSLDNSPVPVGG